MATDEQRPPLRIVRGEPTAEEIAVLTAVVSAAGESGEDAPPQPHGTWNDPARLQRRRLEPGPGAWSASYR